MNNTKKYFEKYLVNPVSWILSEAKRKQIRYFTDELWDMAIKQSAEYVEANSDTALIFDTKKELWDYSYSKKSIESGLNLEFGVWKGESINYFSQKSPNDLFFGFDSFEGLAEDWYGTSQPAGGFNLDGNLPSVNNNVKLIKGWFTESVPDFLCQHDDPVSFLHLDADTYQSTKDVLNLLSKRILPGTVIVFDEYLGYPNWRNGEIKAFREFISENNITYRYLAFSRPHQAAVIIT